MTKKNLTKEVALQSDKPNSRRALLKKTAVGVPVVLSLTNKPAFGAVCSLSGFTSVNPSGVARHNVGCGGISPGGWKQNGYKSGNQDGNRNQWISAGFYPNPRIPASYGFPNNATQYPNDPDGALFFGATTFQGATPTVNVAADDTLHDVLLKNPGSLEFHTISNFLNAKYFGWGNGDGKISAEDVRGVYLAYTNLSQSSYTTTSGIVINFSGFNLHDFFAQLYH